MKMRAVAYKEVSHVDVRYSRDVREGSEVSELQPFCPTHRDDALAEVRSVLHVWRRTAVRTRQHQQTTPGGVHYTLAAGT